MSLPFTVLSTDQGRERLVQKYKNNFKNPNFFHLEAKRKLFKDDSKGSTINNESHQQTLKSWSSIDGLAQPKTTLTFYLQRIK